MTGKDIQRGADVLVLVMATCEKMAEVGTMELGSMPALTTAGYARVTALQDAGFEPTAEEVARAMTWLAETYAVRVIRAS